LVASRSAEPAPRASAAASAYRTRTNCRTCGNRDSISRSRAHSQSPLPTRSARLQTRRRPSGSRKCAFRPPSASSQRHPLPAKTLLHLRGVSLHPATNRRVVDPHPVLSPRRFQVTATDRIATVPAHSPAHELALEVPTLVIIHATALRPSHHGLFTSQHQLCNRAIKSLSHQGNSPNAHPSCAQNTGNSFGQRQFYNLFPLSVHPISLTKQHSSTHKSRNQGASP